MVKILSFIVFFFTAQFFAQEYVPLLKAGNKWYEHHKGYTFDGYGDESFTYIIINGEEIRDGKVYKKLFSNLYCYSPQYPFPCNATGNADQFYKLLREDINTRKVYYYDEGTNSEVLLYDFSLNIGDLLPMNFPFRANNSSHIPGDIVPVFTIIKNGTVFSKTVPNTFLTQSNAKIYEGIGSNLGLLYILGGPIFEGGQILECFETLASGKSCNATFLASNEISVPGRSELVYLKNTHSFRLIGKSSDKFLLQLFDFSGKLVETKDIASNEDFTLNNVRNSGIFLYKLTSSKGSSTGKIFIP